MLRVASLVVVLLVATAAPAAAQEPKQCVGQSLPKPPPTAAEKEQANLEDWARQRAEFGFRADLPYVRELVRRGVWEYDAAMSRSRTTGRTSRTCCCTSSAMWPSTWRR